MAKFFKSDLFKCVATLLALMLVLGGILAVLNDLLYVSPQERTDRAIKKIYGSVPEYKTILDVDSIEPDVKKTPIENKYGKIEKIYIVGEDTLYKSIGFEGYKGGTITLWIKVVEKDGHQQIAMVLQDSFDKQTLMSKFNQDYYDNFLIDVTEHYENGTYIFSKKVESGKIDNAMSGATYSANAACYAVNCVIEYLTGGNA